MIFKDKTGWNLARVKFLVAFITALYKAKTVNFLKLSEALGGQTQVESNLRKIQRFFAGYVIDTDLITKLIFSLLPGHAPYRLCLDRTNWKFGKTDINILTLGVCYEGVAIPLMWTMLAKRGNSNQRERMELIKRYIKLFGANTIESILADREFIGDDWISDLTKLKIKFYFRIKENMLVFVPGKGVRQAYQFLITCQSIGLYIQIELLKSARNGCTFPV